MEKEKIEDELTFKIIGCAMRVHSELGNGFQEVIYQRSLALEFEKNNIPFERELEMIVYYDGVPVGKRRVDFIVQKEVMIELKAVIRMEEAHLAQGLNYLVAYNLDRGLLINFGSRSLETKRLRNPRKKII